MAALDASLDAAPVAPSATRVRRHRFAALAPAALPAWRALARESLADNAFFDPAFAVPAMAALAPAARLATVAAPDGALVAAAPFVETRLGRIAPAARIWSHNYGPLGLPLVARAGADEAIAALVAGLAPSRSLIVPDLPLESPVARAFLAAAGNEGRPVAVLGTHVRAALDPATGMDPRSSLATRRRKEYARQFRRLSDLGRVAFTVTASPEDTAAAFARFLVLEASGWKGRRGTAIVSSPPVAAFARAAVQAHAEAGNARIAELTLDGAPLAIVVCFLAGSTAFTWKIAYDERYARFSPGAQAMLDLPEHLAKDGHITRIDSLADPDHPMIGHLWQGRIGLGTLVIGPPGGSLLHSAGLAAARAERSARETARRLLRR